MACSSEGCWPQRFSLPYLQKTCSAGVHDCQPAVAINRLLVQDATGVDRHPQCEHSCLASASRARQPNQALPDLTDAEKKFSQAAYIRNCARPPKLASISLLQHDARAPKCSFLAPDGKTIHVQSPDDVWHRAGASGLRHSLSASGNPLDQPKFFQPALPHLTTLSTTEHQQSGTFNCWPQRPARQQSVSSMSLVHSKSRPSPASQRIPKYAWSSGEESADEADPPQAGGKHAISARQEQQAACPGPDEAQLQTRINRAWQSTGGKHYTPPQANPAAQRRPADARALRLRVQRLSPAMHLDDSDDSDEESQAHHQLRDPAWPAAASLAYLRSAGSLLRASAGRARDM